jgi:hypothetical protein
MAKQQPIEWANHDFLRGLAVRALLLTLFGTAWAGAPAGTMSMTPVATALAFSMVGWDTVALGWGW